MLTWLMSALPQPFNAPALPMTLPVGLPTWVASENPDSPRLTYEIAIQEAAQLYHLDPALIRSVIQTESAFDTLAVSPVGALGLMQLMPEVAAEMGVRDPFDPRQNIMGGARLLRSLLSHFKGNVTLALAGYNQDRARSPASATGFRRSARRRIT